MLPDPFPMSSLRMLYEHILGVPLDRGNFPRQFLEVIDLGPLVALTIFQRGGHTPAKRTIKVPHERCLSSIKNLPCMLPTPALDCLESRAPSSLSLLPSEVSARNFFEDARACA